MGRKRILKKKELLEAIQGSYGIISTIAKRLHCNWHTVNNTIKLYPECMQALADENETVLDFTESKAIERIKDGDGAMIRFLLATKGRKRGYGETAPQVLDDAEDNDLTIEIVDGGDED